MKEIMGKQVYDSLGEMVQPQHTALIVVDMQNDFCSAQGSFAKRGRGVSPITAIVPRLARVVEQARELGVLVVFIQNTTLPGGRSDSPAWLRLKTNHGLAPDYTLDGTWGQEILPELRPRADEPVVRKHRSTAFVGTDLDLVLKSHRIESIIVTGVNTHACVEATARDGVYRDYYVVVLKDCVGAGDPELHRAALKVMSHLMDVVSSDEVLDAWSRLSPASPARTTIR